MFFQNKLFNFLFKQYLFCILLFGILRLVFIYVNGDPLQNYSLSAIASIFGIGFQVDSCVCSIIILIAIIISYVFFCFKKNFHLPLSLFLISLNSFVVLMNIIDCFYYKQFGCRLNYQALEIFHDKGHALAKTLYDSFPVIKILIVFIGVALMFRFLQKKIKQENCQNIKHKHFAFSFLLFGIFTFLYTGYPFWSMATTSSSLLNTASLNGAYTLVKSIDQNNVYKESIPDYKLCENNKAVDDLKKLITKSDEVCIDGNIPTLRKINTKQAFTKKNIVIIIMESFGANYIGKCNINGVGFSPHFDSLCKEGLFFTNCRSNGPRSQYGIISIVSGFPAIQGTNLQRRKGINLFETIGNVLSREGYQTQFIHNGDAGFDDMDNFFSQGGFQTITDIKKFKTWKFKTDWGVCDEDLYDKTYSLMRSKTKQPTLSVLMTLSNHSPNDVPQDFCVSHPETKQMTKKQVSYYYSDYALGKFVEKCKLSPEYENTLFLIIADHGEAYVPDDNQYKIFHIPALLLNSSKGVGTFDKICSQCDFATTILHDINFPGNFHFVGQDVLSTDYKPFAFSRAYGNDVLLNINDSLAMRYYFETKEIKYYKLSSDKRSLTDLAIQKDQYKKEEALLLSYLQSTSYIFKGGKYHLENEN